MVEGADKSGQGRPTDREGDRDVQVRVEPDAAVVSMHAQVPPASDETPVAFRPVATARAVGGRIRRLVTGRGGARSSGDR
ncbi:hypothetical protein [Halobaculum magnesiiphilum]|uniref:Uncharacterized protein n=1 Tax=Halobaculum magnesiiphilum TaxID=1017351 RepID=A0A8T8WG09_9EURY|nr:hypothetical protein [Halobaculum magnesiiphilum]QZP38802.1 hypothetical protein K6T50_06600 [Halobaculum magnesiiphilum]